MSGGFQKEQRMNYDVLKEKFPSLKLISKENMFDKLISSANELVVLLEYLKNNAQYDFDRLNTIIAVDLGETFELIYDLHSIGTPDSLRVSIVIPKSSPVVDSVVTVFKSAYFDECEIFDMFGIRFNNNPNLKRLFMPKGWIGHPMRKDYKQEDERLSWNNAS